MLIDNFSSVFHVLSILQPKALKVSVLGYLFKNVCIENGLDDGDSVSLQSKGQVCSMCSIIRIVSPLISYY